MNAPLLPVNPAFTGLNTALMRGVSPVGYANPVMGPATGLSVSAYDASNPIALMGGGSSLGESGLLTGQTAHGNSGQLALLNQDILQYEALYGISDLGSLLEQGLINPAMLLAYPRTRIPLVKIAHALGTDYATLTQLVNDIHRGQHWQHATALGAGTAGEVQAWTIAQALSNISNPSQNISDAVAQLDQAALFLKHALGQLASVSQSARASLLTEATAHFVPTDDGIAHATGGNFLQFALQGYEGGILHLEKGLHVGSAQLNWEAPVTFGLVRDGQYYRNSEGTAIITKLGNGFALVFDGRSDIAAALLNAQATAEDSSVVIDPVYQRSLANKHQASYERYDVERLNADIQALRDASEFKVASQIFNVLLEDTNGQNFALRHVTTLGPEVRIVAQANTTLSLADLEDPSELSYTAHLTIPGFDDLVSVPLPTNNLALILQVQEELARQLVERQLAGPAAVEWFRQRIELI